MLTDKTYTFRHYNTIECEPETMSLYDLKKQLVSDVLARGYVPLPESVRAEVKQYLDGYTHLASCVSAYAGKKKAPEIYKDLC